MTFQTDLGRTEDAGAAAKRVCRRLFSVEQAAAFARVPVKQIWHWIMTGKLVAYRMSAGRVRIDEVELADLLSARDARGGTTGSVQEPPAAHNPPVRVPNSTATARTQP
jgi:hypothetical protein